MGRPRGFDTEQAIDAAMQAFWDYGYGTTSMSDLMEAMNLKKGSIYKAFGDKHTLFILALERYLDDLSLTTRDLIESEKSPKKGIRRWLQTIFTNAYKQDLKRGCLLINTINERAHVDVKVEKLIDSFMSQLALLIEQKIKAGQALGEFRDDMSPNDITRVILMALTGTWTLSKGPMDEQSSLKNMENLLKLLDK